MFNAIREQIEWYRMKRIASAHPFFEIKGRLLSKRDAEALLQGREIPDGREVVRQARAELGIPEPIDGAASTKRAPGCQGWLSTHALRKVIAVTASLIILSGFLSFSDTGRAFAESIYKVIVSIINGSLQSHNESVTDNIEPIDFSVLPNEFESLEEIAAITKRPIVVLNSEGIILSEYSAHIVGEESLVIISTYTQDGMRTCTLVQSLNNNFVLWGGYYNTIDENVEEVDLVIGIKAYLSVMDEGAIYAEAFGQGYDINISSYDMSIGEIRDILSGIHFLK